MANSVNELLRSRIANHVLGLDTPPDVPIVWIERGGYWLITGYTEASAVLRDEATFTKDDRFRLGARDFWGRRHLDMLTGKDQRRLHALTMRLTDEKFAESIRHSSVRPWAQQLMNTLISRGRGDLVADYADRLTLYVGCDYLGFDSSDDTFINEIDRLRPARDTWKESLLSDSQDVVGSMTERDGRRAIAELTDSLLPVIRARHDTPQDDLISALWREGPRLFHDWDEGDVVAQCWSLFEGGETKLLLRNMLWLLLVEPAVRGQITADRELLPGFVEESLRYLVPITSLNRVATKDVAIGDAMISKGQEVRVAVAATGFDGKQWDCPNDFDATRTNSGHHLSFGLGPRYCVGRHVVRVIATECIDAFISADVPTVIDDTMPAAEWIGRLRTSSVAPLHVRFGCA